MKSRLKNALQNFAIFALVAVLLGSKYVWTFLPEVARNVLLPLLLVAIIVGVCAQSKTVKSKR